MQNSPESVTDNEPWAETVPIEYDEPPPPNERSRATTDGVVLLEQYLESLRMARDVVRFAREGIQLDSRLRTELHNLDTDLRASERTDVGEGVDLLAGQTLARLVDWTTFWKADHKAEDWLIPGLVATGRVHALYAKAKQGKSTVVLDAIASAVAGRSVWGQDPVDPITVLYLDYEMTAGDLYDRLQSLGYDHTADLSRLHYALLPPLKQLDRADDGRALLAAAQTVGADLVVIDTTGRAVQGLENDSSTYLDLYRCTISELKRHGIASLRVDHSGKDESKGQRGSSAKNDDPDIVWHYKRTDHGGTLTATHRRMSWVPETIQLHGVPGADDFAGFQLVESDEVWPVGTETIAAQLERAGIPVEVSANEAARLFREAGNAAQSGPLKKAQMWRKRHSKEPGTTPGTTPFESASEPVREPAA